MNKEQLEAQISQQKCYIAVLQGKLDFEKQSLQALESSPVLHIYKDLDEAEWQLTEIMRNQAFEDCEGAGNYGLDEYEQEFIVDGILYEGKLEVEYNRHDKTYYYIDRSEWSYVEIGPWKEEE